MHEMSVLDALQDEVRSHLSKGDRLLSVRIDVGAFEHLDADVMCTGWQALTEGADLAGSHLTVEIVSARIRCRICRQEYQPDELSRLVCPECGAVRPEIMAGTGILLRSLEVEQQSMEAAG